MIKKDLELDAVLDRDLLVLLGEFGLREKLDAQQLRCPECDKVITFENIGALRVVDGLVTIICNDYACLADAEI